MNLQQGMLQDHVKKSLCRLVGSFHVRQMLRSDVQRRDITIRLRHIADDKLLGFLTHITTRPFRGMLPVVGRNQPVALRQPIAIKLEHHP